MNIICRHHPYPTTGGEVSEPVCVAGVRELSAAGVAAGACTFFAMYAASHCWEWAECGGGCCGGVYVLRYVCRESLVGVSWVRRGVLRGRVRSSLCMPRVTGGRELSAAGVAAGACTFFAMYAASHWWAWAECGGGCCGGVYVLRYVCRESLVGVSWVRRGLLRGRVRSSLCMPRVTGERELSAAGVAAGACTFFAMYAASHWWVWTECGGGCCGGVYVLRYVCRESLVGVNWVRRGLLRGRVRSSLCMPRVTGGCELSAAEVAAGACTFFALYAASHWWAWAECGGGCCGGVYVLRYVCRESLVGVNWVRRRLLRGRVRSSLCMPRVTGGRELSAAGVAAGACTFFALYAASHWWVWTECGGGCCGGVYVLRTVCRESLVGVSWPARYASGNWLIDRYDVKLASKYDQEFCGANLRKCFVPSQNLSVDEAMIQFDGRLAWKQFVRKKPINVGALALQELLSQCIL